MSERFKASKESKQIKNIVREFYEWEREHRGECLKNPEAATTLLSAINKLKKNGRDKEWVDSYGFDIQLLEKGILKSLPVKN